jgi:alpha-beta hydrolase superfamily lysophospholipase
METTKTKTYEVEARETVFFYYTVEAENEEKARKLVEEGLADHYDSDYKDFEIIGVSRSE